MSTSDEVENEVAFAALAGWEQGLKDALRAYCDYCRTLSPRELAHRPTVLLDFNVWIDPRGAANDMPLERQNGDVADAAAFLARRIRSKDSDPYAIISTLKRECEK